MSKSWSNPTEYEAFMRSIPARYRQKVRSLVTIRAFYTHPPSGDKHWVEFEEKHGDSRSPHVVWCDSCGTDNSVLRHYTPI
jgi:hypothetical protein